MQFFFITDKFPDLVQFVTANLEQLPENVHNSLIQTIATISSGAGDAQVRDQYLGLIYSMVEVRRKKNINNQDVKYICIYLYMYRNVIQ